MELMKLNEDRILIDSKNSVCVYSNNFYKPKTVKLLNVECKISGLSFLK